MGFIQLRQAINLESKKVDVMYIHGQAKTVTLSGLFGSIHPVE
jgi:hypothetical protein